jgi:predicted DNA-binding transcriptional regulator YafY
MARTAKARRRPAIQISIGRAARLYRLVLLLAEEPTARDVLLARLAIGLRTFYRELDLLRRCAIEVRRTGKTYQLAATVAEAEVRLPFPDPQLSFAEMAELSRHPGEAARRLAAILQGVIAAPSPPPERRGRRSSGP